MSRNGFGLLSIDWGPGLPPRYYPMNINQTPDDLNDFLIAISLAMGVYCVFRWHGGGGIVWKIVLGACLYFFAAGLYQKLMKKNRTPEK
jgi:hypothetical protein